MNNMDAQIEKLQKLIDDSERIAAITGAGISVSAGINDMEHLDLPSTIQMMSETILKTVPKHYYRIVRKGFLDATFEKGPTEAHKKLAELEKSGKLIGIITTNIDCMHSATGNKNVAEIQGSFRINICLGCGCEYVDLNLWNQGSVPRCPKCKGYLSAFPVHSRVGTYEPAVRQARKWLSQADLILTIGSKGMYCGVYWNHVNPGAKIVQINPKSTDFDDIAILNIRAGADEILGKIHC